MVYSIVRPSWLRSQRRFQTSSAGRCEPSRKASVELFLRRGYLAWKRYSKNVEDIACGVFLAFRQGRLASCRFSSPPIKVALGVMEPNLYASASEEVHSRWWHCFSLAPFVSKLAARPLLRKTAPAASWGRRLAESVHPQVRF